MKTGNLIRKLLIGSLCGTLICSIYGCQKHENQKVTAGKNITLEQDTNPEFAIDQIRTFQVDADGRTKYKFDYIPRTDRERFLYWDLSIPYESIAIVDTEVMYALYEKAEAIWKTKKLSLSKKEPEGGYGINQSQTKIAVTYVSDKEHTKDAQQADKKAVLLIGNSNGNGQYYCAAEGAENQVYQVDSYLVDAAIEKEPYDMILKVPYLVNIKTVKEVKIKLKDGSLRMERRGDSYKLNGEVIAEDAYQKLYSNLLQPGITGTYSSDKKVGEKILSICYKRTSKEYEDYQVNIYQSDDKEDLIEVNGRRFFMVGKEEVDGLVKVIESTCK